MLPCATLSKYFSDCLNHIFDYSIADLLLLQYLVKIQFRASDFHRNITECCEVFQLFRIISPIQMRLNALLTCAVK